MRPPWKLYPRPRLRHWITSLGLTLVVVTAALVAWRSRDSQASLGSAVAPASRIHSAVPLRVTPAPAPAPSPTPEPSSPYPYFVTRAGNVVVMAPGAVSDDGSYDVLVHFHGVHTALEPALRQSGLHAVLVVVNVGIGTKAYRERYSVEGMFDALLRGLRAQIARRRNLPGAHERHVAVSAWSAGFGAVVSLLRQPAVFARIDALFLADALYVAYIDPRRRIPSDQQLAPLVEFAKLAKSGRRLFGLTHTNVPTVGYSNTADSAHRLLQLVDLVETPVEASVASDPSISTRLDQGNLHVLGFVGADRSAHVHQQWAIGATLWSRLAQRWR